MGAKAPTLTDAGTGRPEEPMQRFLAMLLQSSKWQCVRSYSSWEGQPLHTRAADRVVPCIIAPPDFSLIVTTDTQVQNHHVE